MPVARLCAWQYALFRLLRLTDVKHLCRYFQQIYSKSHVASHCRYVLLVENLSSTYLLLILQPADFLPPCLQVVSTADLIFVFGSAAEIRDHLKNVKDSIKDRLIVPVTKEGQIDTFQVSSDTGDSGALLVSTMGPSEQRGSMQVAMWSTAQLSYPIPRWAQWKGSGPLVFSTAGACRLCCPASAEVVVVQPP